MRPLAPRRTTRCDRRRRAIASVLVASIGLATGCSSTRSLGDGSPAAAAPAIETEEAPTDTASTDTAPAPLPSLHDLLAQDRFVALKVALERSGLDSVLDGLDDLVLLAPTDAAFASSGPDIGIEYPTLMNDPRLLEAIMRYHIVDGPSMNQSWRTLNGATLDVDGTAADTVERVDGVDVLDRIPVRNGTVLVMPQLLLPAPDPFVAGTESEQGD